VIVFRSLFGVSVYPSIVWACYTIISFLCVFFFYGSFEVILTSSGCVREFCFTGTVYFYVLVFASLVG
jgi:hypothetical protein